MDSYALATSYPATGDPTTSPSLWLASVTRTGQDGGTPVTLPPVSFAGTPLPNRVQTAADTAAGYSQLTRFYLSSITNVTGGVTTVAYTAPDPAPCAAGTFPAPASNTAACYPDNWTPPGATGPVQDWFNQYAVTSTTQADTTGGDPNVVTSYAYTGPAWHYDTGTVSRSAPATYDQWRGFGQVTTETGTAPDPVTENRHHLPAGHEPERPAQQHRARPSPSPRPAARQVTDSNQFAGVQLEQIIYTGAGTGQQVTDTVNLPWTSTAVVGQHQPEPGRVRHRHQLRPDLHRPGRRRHQAIHGQQHLQRQRPDHRAVHHPRHRQHRRVDLHRHHLRRQHRHRADQPARHRHHRRRRLQRLRQRHRRAGIGDRELLRRPGTRHRPHRREPHQDREGHRHRHLRHHHQHLRPVRPRPHHHQPRRQCHHHRLHPGHRRRAHLGHVHRPAWAWSPPPPTTPPANSPSPSPTPAGNTTTDTYDALGRKTAEWTPGNPTTGPATTTYSYTVSSTAPPVITEQDLEPGGNYLTTETIFDSFGNVREVQQGTAGGGADITDTTYNSDGWNGLPIGSLLRREPAVRHSRRSSRQQRPRRNRGRLRRRRPRHPAGLLRRRHRDLGNRHHLRRQLHHRHPARRRHPADDLDRRTRAHHRDLAVPRRRPGLDQRPRQRLRRHQLHLHRRPEARHDHRRRRQRLVLHLRPARRPAHPDLPGLREDHQHLRRGPAADDGHRRPRQDDLVHLRRRRPQDRRIRHHRRRRREQRRRTRRPGPTTRSPRASSPRPRPSRTGRPTPSRSPATPPTGSPSGTETIIPASQGALAGTYTQTYTYAPDGQQTSYTDSAAGGLPAETVTTGYDNAGNPNSLTGASPYVDTLSYTNLGQPQQYTMGTSSEPVYITDSYDPQTGNLTQQNTQTGTAQTQVDDLNYAYNNAGAITSEADTPAGGPANVQCFQYDYLGRLAQAWAQGTSGCAATPSASAEGGAAPYWQSLHLQRRQRPDRHHQHHPVRRRHHHRQHLPRRRRYPATRHHRPVRHHHVRVPPPAATATTPTAS